jgi:glucose/arabinose dehydrogenase
LPPWGYIITGVWLIAALTGLCVVMPAGADLKTRMMMEAVSLPPGFEIDLYTGQVPGARSMALSPSGVLYVGTRQNGRVYAVIDEDRDFAADRVITLIDGLTMPNGVAFDQGDLFVAEVGRILRFPAVEEHLDDPGRPEVVFDQLPKDLAHGWKFIGFGPDGMLYIPIGAPCNVCLSEDPRYATISRIHRDGSGFEVYVKGVRNSVGFDWHPLTRRLWFTDNGRDWLGDDQPPDELNFAPVQGLHFGFPHCHGGSIADPQFGSTTSCEDYMAPVARLGPHVAALGMRFYTGQMFPEAYRGQVFIAEHGSWNRSQKIGYRISLVRLDGNKAVSYEPFAQGWLIGNSAWGRPVDVAIMADGSLLVSDDQSGVIYRISYKDPTTEKDSGISSESSAP